MCLSGIKAKASSSALSERQRGWLFALNFTLQIDYAMNKLQG
jgi:hypothetical protein